MRFDFSGLNAGDPILENFTIQVKAGLQDFANRYVPDSPRIRRVLEAPISSPTSLLQRFFIALTSEINDKIYLIVDGFDQFAQAIFSDGLKAYKALAEVERRISPFYTALKSATQNKICRVFFLGEMATSLDGMLFGFDGALAVSEFPRFAGMMGFTEDELRALIPQVVDVDRYGHSVDQIYERMKALYAGYRFSRHSDVSVFNPSSCLYYLNEIARTNKEPEVLFEPTYSNEFTQLENILSVGRKSYVDELVENTVHGKGINLYADWRFIHFLEPSELSGSRLQAALIFKGYLTFSPEDPDMLVCPNRVIKDLFFKYWFRRMSKVDGIVFPETASEDALKRLATGDLTDDEIRSLFPLSKNRGSIS